MVSNLPYNVATPLLARLLDVLGYDRVHLCGLSMGGGIALGFALAYPAELD